MIVFEDGNYETGDWLTVETYPDKVTYVVEEGSELAAKIAANYPYYTLDVAGGVLIDVTLREKTPEEIAAENAPPPKTADQLRIDTLEAESADLWYNTMLKNSEHDTEIADLWYAVMTGGASA